MILFVLSIMLLVVGAVFGVPGQRQNMMRLARSGGDQAHLTGGDVVRGLMATRALDRIGGGELLKALDPHTGGQIFRSLDRAHLLDSLDGFQGGEVVRMLDAITGGDLLSSLDSAEGTAVLGALRRTAHPARAAHPKRMLDSVSGWAFGESKRNFDEIDNVGFTGFAKRGRTHSSLAKRNFDEIDRAGFETYNKRNFDEIDRAGFETFEKKGGQ